MRIKITLLLLFISSLSAYDLKMTVKELLSTNPTILERLQNYQATQKNITKAESEYYPSIDLSLGYGIENTEQKKSNQNTQLSVYQNSLKYTQNLFNGFGTKYRVKEEEYKSVAAAYSYIEAVNNTTFEMTNSYIQVMQNQELLSTAQENVTINEDIAQKVRKLYDAGLTTLSEVNKIESSLALAKANLVVQENTILNVAYTFEKILGRNIDPTKMKKPLIMVKFPNKREEAVNFAIKNNPSLLVNLFNIKSLQATKQKASSLFYPKLDVVVSQTMSKNLGAIEGENSKFQAMAYLSYNLFNGFSDSATLQQSATNIQKEIEVQNALKRNVIESFNLSWAAKTKLQEQLHYLKEYRNFSLQTLDLYSKEYDLGRRSLLDLLSAQNDFIKAKAQIIKTEYTLLSSKYKILYNMGTLVMTLLDNTAIVYTTVDLNNSMQR